MATSGNVKVIFNNKRANFDFELLERFEAGLVLTGTEIKSIRANHVSLQRSFVQAKGDELWLLEANISPYEHGNRENHEPTRPRKLLLHRREINRILGTQLVKDRITALGGEALPLTPAEFAAKATEDSKRFGAIIRERKISGD